MPRVSSMKRQWILRTVCVAIPSVLLALSPSAAANHSVDSSGNDSCAQAGSFPGDNVDHYGHLDGYPSDYRDFYKRWVDADSHIYAWMYPMASGADFNLVLYDPHCTQAAFDYASGQTPEDVSFTATTSGWWYVEVWAQVGSGDYAIYWEVSSPPPPPPCEPTSADPTTYNVVDVLGTTFYAEERGNPLGTSPPVPGSGLLLGQGTWVYEESNGWPGLQRAGLDETCGFGGDALVV